MAYGIEPRATKHMGGRFSDIALSFVVVTLPLLLFAGLLLGLVFHYRVTHNDVPFENLQLDGARDEPGIYYVNLNSTFLVFIASWSSSVAPMLASFALVLAAYPICKEYLAQAQAHRQRELLTPYQLALTLRFMNGGGFGALWTWLKYLAGWKNVREPQGRVLSSTASVAILASSLGAAVFLADTWLHVTTKTVDFLQVTPVAAVSNYSLTLIPGCTIANNSFSAQASNYSYACSVNIAATAIFFVNASQSLQVLNNVSESVAVLTYESNPPYTYLGIPPSDELSKRDYTATTFGMNTQCKAVSNECNLKPLIGASTPFRCSDAFQGDVTQDGWQMAYFNDSTMTSNDTLSGVNNPYYFGLATIVNAGGGGTIAFNTSEVVNPVHGGLAFVLFCSVTMYDVEYDSVNGTVTRFVTKLSNDSVANAWQSSIAQTTGDVGTLNLEQAAILATFSTTAQEIADKMALAYSQVGLAVGAQVVTPSPALAVQERQSFLVTRVPAAPLFTLVIANLLFVLLGIILTCIAIRTSGGEVRELQARLSIVGLVADRFEVQRGRDGVEKLDDYFEEKDGNDSMRVAIDRGTGGGYTYTVWPKLG